MGLTPIHSGIALACVISSAVVGTYGLWRFWRRDCIDKVLWGLVIIAQGLYLAQGMIGMAMVAQGLAPSRGGVHFLYGIVILVVFPLAYTFSRGRSGRREILMYALLGVFLTGVALRAIATGQAP
jgi:heme A synthase